ncbi:MAG TPA: glutaredoxin family protein [Polyangiaceae bacterium]|nr:glutaredoxin family protein [Polyangiaceae bacterium]
MTGQHQAGAAPGAAAGSPAGAAAPNQAGAPAERVAAARVPLEPEVRRLNIALPLWTLAIPVVGLALCLVVLHGAFASEEVVAGDSAAGPAPSAVSAEPTRPPNDSRAPDSDGQASPGALHGDSLAVHAPRTATLQGTPASERGALHSAPVSSTARKPSESQPNISPQLAAARENVELKVYYTEWCPTCRALRRYIAERGIRAVEYDVEKDREAAARYRKLNPRHTIPTIDIDGQVLIGFNPELIQAVIDRTARTQLARGI